MFGLLVAGRLPQTTFTQLDETHCVFELDGIADINHLCVFMDGSAPFPPGYAGTVHLLLPTSTGGAGQGWRLLGCLKNQRPSAIYRLRGLLNNAGGNNNTWQDQSQIQGGTSSALFSSQGLDANPAMFEATTSTGSAIAMLGISVESEQDVDEQMRLLQSGSAMGQVGAAGGQGMDIAEEGMTLNSEAGSLVRSGGQIDPYMALALAPKIAQNIFSYLSSFAPDSAPQTVPLLQKWLEQFERKLKMQGSAWLERQGGEGG